MKWEYLQYGVTSSNAGRIQEKLDELGLEGWELVQVTNYPSDSMYSKIFYFKRPASNKNIVQGKKDEGS